MTREALIAIALMYPNAKDYEYEKNIDTILSVSTVDVDQRVMLGTGYFESLWGKFTLGDCHCKKKIKIGSIESVLEDDCPNYNDRNIFNCTSFGVMQTKSVGFWLKGATPERVYKDIKLGYMVGLNIWKHCMKQCNNNVKDAYGLYMSGIGCGAVKEKTEKRCKYIGC